jgi:hypothetical protein
MLGRNSRGGRWTRIHGRIQNRAPRRRATELIHLRSPCGLRGLLTVTSVTAPAECSMAASTEAAMAAHKSSPEGVAPVSAPVPTAVKPQAESEIRAPIVG